MRLINKIATGIGVVTLSALSLLGCKEKYIYEIINKFPNENPYFVIVPMTSRSGIAIIGGDFDEDGDIDFIVGTRINSFNTSRARKLYFFENDGKGNFKVRSSYSE